MRYAFLITILSVLSLSVSAQGYKTMYGGNSKSIDTVKGSATEYLTTADDELNRSTSGVYEVAINLSNDSATSTGYAILQSSNDRVNWANHFGTPGTNGKNCDTFSFSGSTYHIVHCEPNALRYDDTHGNSVPINSKSGRRLHFRWVIVHTGNGKTSYTGGVLTTDR